MGVGIALGVTAILDTVAGHLRGQRPSRGGVTGASSGMGLPSSEAAVPA